VGEDAALGTEAIWTIEGEGVPACSVVDDKGNDFFAGNLG
jgi:tartrate dehydratase beta subunit/fumarate hydratase class I family protein